MDQIFKVTAILKKHYKTFFVILSSTLAIYLLRKFISKKGKKVNNDSTPKDDEFPTVGDIQKIIQEIPPDKLLMDTTVSLKDLLSELSEFSDDEEWKELIQSVHVLYQEAAT